MWLDKAAQDVATANAIAFTGVPDTLKMFVKSYGGIPPPYTVIYSMCYMSKTRAI